MLELTVGLKKRGSGRNEWRDFGGKLGMKKSDEKGVGRWKESV